MNHIPMLTPPSQRNVSTVQMQKGVDPSIDWKCLVKCAGSLAQCVADPNPVQCLIRAGAGDCVSCLT